GSAFPLRCAVGVAGAESAGRCSAAGRVVVPGVGVAVAGALVGPAVGAAVVGAAVGRVSRVRRSATDVLFGGEAGSLTVVEAAGGAAGSWGAAGCGWLGCAG